MADIIPLKPFLQARLHEAEVTLLRAAADLRDIARRHPDHPNRSAWLAVADIAEIVASD